MGTLSKGPAGYEYCAKGEELSSASEFLESSLPFAQYEVGKAMRWTRTFAPGAKDWLEETYAGGVSLD